MADPAPAPNAATRIIASMLGALIGLSSINHGLLEMLQGNRPTPGHVVNALGAGYHWTAWSQGSELAFTLVPNFLLTGLLATLTGLLMILWSLRFLHKPHGPAIFFLLGVASFLTGGGIAQVVLFTLNALVAARIRSALGFWRWLLPMPLCKALGRLWPWTMAVFVFFFLGALEVAVFGYIPGVPGDPKILRAILLCQLAPGVGSLLLTFVCGFASDIAAHSRPRATR